MKGVAITVLSTASSMMRADLLAREVSHALLEADALIDLARKA